MVTVKWKHSASCKEWRGVDGPSSSGFLVLNRPPNVILSKSPIKMPVHTSLQTIVDVKILFDRQCPTSIEVSSSTQRCWMRLSTRRRRTATLGSERPVLLGLSWIRGFHLTDRRLMVHHDHLLCRSQVICMFCYTGQIGPLVTVTAGSATAQVPHILHCLVHLRLFISRSE